MVRIFVRTVTIISPTGTIWHKVGALRALASEDWEKSIDFPVSKGLQVLKGVAVGGKVDTSKACAIR